MILKETRTRTFYLTCLALVCQWGIINASPVAQEDYHDGIHRKHFPGDTLVLAHGDPYMLDLVYRMHMAAFFGLFASTHNESLISIGLKPMRHLQTGEYVLAPSSWDHTPTTTRVLGWYERFEDVYDNYWEVATERGGAVYTSTLHGLYVPKTTLREHGNAKKRSAPKDMPEEKNNEDKRTMYKIWSYLVFLFHRFVDNVAFVLGSSANRKVSSRMRDLEGRTLSTLYGLRNISAVRAHHSQRLFRQGVYAPVTANGRIYVGDPSDNSFFAAAHTFPSPDYQWADYFIRPLVNVMYYTGLGRVLDVESETLTGRNVVLTSLTDFVRGSARASTTTTTATAAEE